MTYSAWLVFILVSLFWSFIVAYGMKLILGKYFIFLVPIPTIFIIVLLLISLIALQALGAPIADFYADFFTWLSKLMSSKKYGGVMS